jgi:hypothetical protein
MPAGGLYWTANATWVEPEFSAQRLFCFLSLNSNSLSLSRSDPLKRKSKNSQWKRKFVFKLKKVFWLGHSLMSRKGWRCNFLTRPEGPKAAKSQILPAMSEANNQISYASFMVSMA